MPEDISYHIDGGVTDHSVAGSIHVLFGLLTDNAWFFCAHVGIFLCEAMGVIRLINILTV